MKNRMLEIGTSGSVRGGDGDIPTYSAGRIGDLAADQSFVTGLAEADRDVRLSFGQIKEAIADHQLDPQSGKACMKGIDQWRSLENIRQARSAG